MSAASDNSDAQPSQHTAKLWDVQALLSELLRFKRHSYTDAVSIFNATMSAASDNSDAQPSQHTEKLWDVQAILAERHSAFQTGSEVLVAWKPCWIPIENVPDGPLLSSFQKARKVRFQSSVGKLILPMELDTALADDVAAATDWAERQIREHREHCQQRCSSKELPKRKRVHGEGTRKKSLDSVAMKAASSTTDQSKNQ
jgi:hypothetical protein